MSNNHPYNPFEILQIMPTPPGAVAIFQGKNGEYAEELVCFDLVRTQDSEGMFVDSIIGMVGYGDRNLEPVDLLNNFLRYDKRGEYERKTSNGNGSGERG